MTVPLPQGVDPLPAVSDGPRLSELRRRRLLDTPAERRFDRLTDLATHLIGAPVSLVSLVDENRQFFKSCVGLPEPWASKRETPLSHSICQYVVATAAPLVLEDVRTDPVLCENRAIEDLGVVAYAGIPLVTKGGHHLGSFCVIDTEPHQWSEQDLELLTELAGAAADLIELRLSDLESGEREAVLRQLVQAQEEERARIAAEVHDDSLQMIIALSMRLQLAAERARDPGLRRTLHEVVESASMTADRLRRLLFDLRPPALDSGCLVAALDAHLGFVFADSGLAWELDDALELDLPPEVAVVLFRIAQGALANVLAHAHATRVEVGVAPADAGVLLSVEDNGCGFEVAQTKAAPGHLGLVTMHERAEMCGGSLTIKSVPGRGTTVQAWIPLR